MTEQHNTPAAPVEAQAEPVDERAASCVERAAEMLAGYIQAIKSNGQYEYWHYIPEVEGVIDELRALAPAQPPQALSDAEIDALLSELDEIARGYDIYEYGLPLGFDREVETTAHEDMRKAISAALAAAGAPAQAPQELTSHQRYWVSIREQVIAALQAEGLTIVSSASGVTLMRLGKITAQAAQAPQASPSAHQIIRGAAADAMARELDAEMMALAPQAVEPSRTSTATPKCDYPDCTRKCGKAGGYCHKPLVAQPLDGAGERGNG